MCSKKKDLEIICNLQWKNKSRNGDVKSSVIGLYDVPSTTLNWEKFKSYLLKNSGTPGDDVHVSYLANNEIEIPILSQLDFQVALYTFREKARNGEIINLKLDRVSYKDKLSPKVSTTMDVQTQFNADGESSTLSMASLELAPAWFTNYMTEFKKDIVQEISMNISSKFPSIKPQDVEPDASGLSTNESCKRVRKHPLSCEPGNEKELLKTIKTEKKVETKLGKLENRCKKLKEKKMSLLTKSNDCEAGPFRNIAKEKMAIFDSLLERVKSIDEGVTKMNAAPVRNQKPIVEHLVGGEVYLHHWDVINNGSQPWTSDTELHFMWGSALLEPVEKIVPCPPLKSGETGSINVLLNVPKTCGKYESYWYFHHKKQKFGHWLGCQIIVDNITHSVKDSLFDSFSQLEANYNKKSSRSGSHYPYCDFMGFPKYFPIDPKVTVRNLHKLPKMEKRMKELEINECSRCYENEDLWTENDLKVPDDFILVSPSSSSRLDETSIKKEPSPPPTEIEPVILEASPSKIQIVENFLNDLDSQMNTRSTLQDTTNNDVEEPMENKQVDGASENDDNNNNTEEAQDSSSESISKIDEDASSNSTINDLVMVNFVDEIEDESSGYAYVSVDGVKVPIPKKYLRSEFLETAEDAPDPSQFVKTINNQDETTGNTEEINEKLQLQENNNSLLQKSCDLEVASRETLLPCAMENSSVKEQIDKVTFSFVSEEAKAIDKAMCPLQSVTQYPDYDLPQEMTDSRLFVFPQALPGYEVGSDPMFSLENELNLAPSDISACSHPFFNHHIPPQEHLGTELQHPQPQQPEPKPVDNTSLFMPSPIVHNDSSQQKPANGDRPEMKESFIYTHVPNYQQTPLKNKLTFVPYKKQSSVEPKETQPSNSTGYSFTCSSGNTYSIPVKEEKIFSEIKESSSNATAPVASMVSGAMTMASSALNTAKNVVQMIIPPRHGHEPGTWVDGHWVVTNPESQREANLRALAEMGFWDRDLNATLLARYNDEIAQVVAELIH